MSKRTDKAALECPSVRMQTSCFASNTDMSCEECIKRNEHEPDRLCGVPNASLEKLKPKINWQREKKILQARAEQWETLSDAQDYTIELLMKDIAKLRKQHAEAVRIIKKAKHRWDYLCDAPEWQELLGASNRFLTSIKKERKK
jgi:hypothetical protein